MPPLGMTHWGLYFRRGPSLAETDIETEIETETETETSLHAAVELSCLKMNVTTFLLEILFAKSLKMQSNVQYD
ncbi:unnamed protein product [Prunus armeniaca]|uniref:Uncharacterized protein n=1 Tax=Prunus armeniaca TaxID=36596 RepID=A0A6J5VL10_PRUAR|nr:unnamed protein product [Prunus armeniaca]